MFPLCCLVAVLLSSDFCVSALIPIAIGEDSIVPVNATVGTPVWHTNPPNPSIHPGYNVSNVGKTAIQANIYWKDSWPLQTDEVFCETRSNCSVNSSVNTWYKLLDTIHINPLESVIIRPSENFFYFTRLVISTPPGNSSIVHVEYEADEVGSARHLKKKRDVKGDPPKLYLCDKVKFTLQYDVKKPPHYEYVKGSGFEALVNLFWPDNQRNVWDEVRDYARHLIDHETFTYINGLLNGRLMAVKLRLAAIANEVKEGQHHGVSAHYMNIAQDLIGLEQEFIIRNHHNAKKLNFDLLPLFSNVVLMKAAYYILGLKMDQEIDQPYEDIEQLKRYFNNAIRSPKTGANHYILEVIKSQQDLPTDPEFDRIMMAQNSMIEQGYVPIWNNMMDRPGEELTDTKIIYSQLIGKQTDQILDYARKQPMVPLTPVMQSTGKFNKLRTLTTYLGPYTSNSGKTSSCIIGINLAYENSATYFFGRSNPVDTTYSVRHVVELGNEHVISALVIEQLDSESASLRAAITPLPNKYSAKPLYYDLGQMDFAWKNISLEKPDYQVASIYPTWLNHECLANFAVSFIPN